MGVVVVECQALARGGFWVTYRAEDGSVWTVIEEFPPPDTHIERL